MAVEGIREADFREADIRALDSLEVAILRAGSREAGIPAARGTGEAEFREAASPVRATGVAQVRVPAVEAGMEGPSIVVAGLERDDRMDARR